MALLGDDGRGYEFARKLESHGVWRSWLGDSLYANFVQCLSSPSSWDAFMRTDDSKTRAQIQLQLRARALLFDKASVSLFLRSNQSSSSSSSAAISKLNPNYLRLHGDDVYFTLESCSQDGVQQLDGVVTSNSSSSKLQPKAALSIRSRYTESDFDNMSQRFRHEELPETWYSQLLAKYRASKAYKLSIADRETGKRTPEQMSTYLRVLEKHKKRRVAFREDQIGSPFLENQSNMHSNSVIDENDAIDDDTHFFPETMFTMNCVPDSALPPTNRTNRVEEYRKIEFNGVLDNLPQVMTRSAIMIGRLGIRPEYLSMEQGSTQSCGKNGSEGNKRRLGQDQASQMSLKVIARVLTAVGFDAGAEVPMDTLSQLLSCHICKLGRILKVLSDSYRKQCSAVELLKMFLQTAGHGNLGALSEIVKDNTRNSAPQAQQQLQGIPSQFQPQHQPPLRQPLQSLQIHRQMNPQMQQQMVQSQTLAFQQQQQWDRIRRRQPNTPRPGMNMTMGMERPMVEVKLENPSEFPTDSNAFASMNARNPQLQFRQQQQLAAMSNFHPQSGNQFRQLASLQIPPPQTPNSGIVRAPPLKVEGFQELMGGDASLKTESEENKLTSPTNFDS